MQASSQVLGQIAEIVDCEHKTAPIATGQHFAYSVGTRALTDNVINFDKCKPVSEPTYNEWSKRAELRAGDIILAREAPVGGVGLVEEGAKVCLGQRTVLVRPNPKIVDSVFLNYLLQTPDVQRWMVQMSNGSTVKHLNVADIKKLPFPTLPTIDEQKLSSSLLREIDLKIDVNAKIAQTLEDIAQSIFSSWFIDFDPVHAKQGDPASKGIDLDLGSQFPERLVQSEIGEIPFGWELTTLGTQILVTKGKSYKSSELADSNTALVTLKSFQRGGGYRTDGLKAFTGNHKPEQEVKAGDLIVSFTDVTQAAEVIGRPAIILPSTDFAVLVASLDVGIVRPVSESMSKFFLYQLLRTRRFASHIEGYVNGTTVLHLGKLALESYKFALPPISLMSKFEEVVKPFEEMAGSLHLENTNLAKLRDALLHRLIGGKVKISSGSEV